MLGYANNDDATAHAITPYGILKHGDIGDIDDDGHIYVVDRLKVLIKYKGCQMLSRFASRRHHGVFLATLHRLHLLRSLSAFPKSAQSFAEPQQRIYTSPHASLDLTPRISWDIVRASSKAIAEKPAFICGIDHEVMTHRDFIANVEKTATALAQRGVTKGTVIITNTINCVEYPILYHALTALGATMSPASPLFSVADLVRQIHASKATFFVTHESVETAARDAAVATGLSLGHCFCIGSPKHMQAFSVLQEVLDVVVPSVELDIKNDVNYLPFSSGTTGQPKVKYHISFAVAVYGFENPHFSKGVKLSFWNMAINMLQMGHGETFTSPAMVVLPLYHIYASTLMNTILVSGQPQVILPKFDHDHFLHCLERYKITKAHIVPPIASFLAKHPRVDDYDLSAMQYLISAAAPMGPGLEEAVLKRLGITVKQCYGMTELSPIVNYTKDDECKSSSTGYLVPNTELRVVCPSSQKDLSPNEVGELWYRGPQVMLGYLNDDDATTNTMTICGFLKTGDLGYIDDHGHVFVVDRLKELIKYKGYQVAPAELEDVILKHPKVLDVACIRGYDTHGEEVPRACVVVKPGERLTSKEIMDFVATHVAPYKKVRQVVFMDVIPKSNSGKILRRELQALQQRPL
ncbi:Aste57867_10965 [Aphanomyces stellatus]|uniref:Aste57867_10965 protein n=1 Tax=Aphanomyces stellatus TaxID=120398 RepID=A0A485KSW2_9STRA|nr:hypothetical protein As57867_010925 [Aphanomyces stellatus]VFT87833.1 Aste57867_10965 [Aphanomyces stellatus]